MGKGYRQGRLGGEIRKIISEMLVHGIKDPRLSSMISVSTVDVTRDGSYARCYITLLSTTKDPEEKRRQEEEVLEGLYSAKGLIKREIGHRIKLHHIPELLFEIDNSMEYGRHITEIIDSLGIENYQSEETEEDDF